MEETTIAIAGRNGPHGTVPSSWAGMAALQDLELDYNCGLCGNLPPFPMQVCHCCQIAAKSAEIVGFAKYQNHHAIDLHTVSLLSSLPSRRTTLARQY